MNATHPNGGVDRTGFDEEQEYLFRLGEHSASHDVSPQAPAGLPITNQSVSPMHKSLKTYHALKATAAVAYRFVHQDSTVAAMPNDNP